MRVGRFTRAVLATLMVGVIAGSALAFAAGVRFTPRASCDDSTVTYGSNCTNVHHKLKKHFKVHGFGRVRHTHGRLKLRFSNQGSATMTVEARIKLQSRNGNVRIVERTFKIKAHDSLRFRADIDLKNVRAGKITVKLSDADGDSATAVKSFGHFK